MRARTAVVVGAEPHHDRGHADGDEESGADLVTSRAELMGHALTETETEERHRRLEEPEHDGDAQSGPIVDSGQSDADRRREI